MRAHDGVMEIDWQGLAFVAAFLLMCLGMLVFWCPGWRAGPGSWSATAVRPAPCTRRGWLTRTCALEAARQGGVEGAVKLVALEAESSAVGLEIHRKAYGLGGFLVVRLTPDEALRLAGVLEQEALR